jgi:integrase/recombinase XerD
MRNNIQSQNFKVLVDAFENWLSALAKSSSTVQHYPLALIEYFEYLEAEHNIKHINRVEKKHSTMFKQHLQLRINKSRLIGGIHNQTINCIIKALNSFNRFMSEYSETLKYGITEKYLPVEHAEKIVLTEQEIEELFEVTYEQYPNSKSQLPFGQRDRVILHLLYSMGIRADEASWIDLSDVDFNNNRILVRKGKGGKQRYVPTTFRVMDEIRSYIENGRYYFMESHENPTCWKRIVKKKMDRKDENALLLNVFGKRLRTFDKRLKYLASKTSITKNVTCHVLRHTLGTHLYQNGMKLNRIQLILGHSSQDTTMIYVHIAKRLDEMNFDDDYNEAV